MSLNGATYTYSPRDLLASGEGVTYKYNGLGQKVLSAKSPYVEASLYDRSNRLASESAQSTSSIAYDYVWLGSIPVAQETLGTSPTTVWTQVNELGAPFLQTSGSGAVTWQADYTPYGGIFDLRVGSATTHQPIRLPGQEAIMLTGAVNQNGVSQLFYNNNRWYVPSIGRYLTPDPLGFRTDPYNQYSYVGNDPSNQYDRSGLQEDVEDPSEPAEADPSQGEDPSSAASDWGDNAQKFVDQTADQYTNDTEAANRAGACPLSAAEQAVLSRAKALMAAKEFSNLRLAHDLGQYYQTEIDGRRVAYEPGQPLTGYEGMQHSEVGGFYLGPGAFSSEDELEQTVLHEMYRSDIGSYFFGDPINADVAGTETNAASGFAAHAQLYLK